MGSYAVRYHNNSRLYYEPFLERIESFLPVRLEDSPVRYWDKFSVNYTFVAEFNDGMKDPDS
jgi:hypothetical protein